MRSRRPQEEEAAAAEAAKMAGGSSGRGEFTASDVLSPRELSQEPAPADVEAGRGGGGQHRGTGGGRGGSGTSGLYSVNPSPRRKRRAQQQEEGGAGVSRTYVRGLWLALTLSLMALAGTVGFQYYMMRERAKEKEATQHLASGTSANSTNALGMARAAHDRSIKLEQAVEALQLQLNSTVQQLQTQAAATAAAADARWLAQCQALLAQQEGEDDQADGAMRTAYICQAQAGWTLPCPGGGVPTVSQALIGRFTSGPDGPCTEGARPGQLALCATSADVTAQVRIATRGGGAVGKTPLQLLADAGRTNPCPRSYLQLQVMYQCPASDPAARAEKCRQALAAASQATGGTMAAVGGGYGAAVAPVPGAAPQK